MVSQGPRLKGFPKNDVISSQVYEVNQDSEYEPSMNQRMQEKLSEMLKLKESDPLGY